MKKRGPGKSDYRTNNSSAEAEVALVKYDCLAGSNIAQRFVKYNPCPLSFIRRGLG